MIPAAMEVIQFDSFYKQLERLSYLDLEVPKKLKLSRVEWSLNLAGLDTTSNLGNLSLEKNLPQRRGTQKPMFTIGCSSSSRLRD